MYLDPESLDFKSNLFLSIVLKQLNIMSLLNRIPLICALAIPLAACISCKKLPETDFTWGPEDNPEAGDIIWFANETPEASYYEWKFGDESESNLENPTHMYAEPGNYEVELTGYNDDGGQTKSRTITINDPTILAFLVVDSTQTLPLEEAEVWIFDNETDWNNFSNPILLGYTNSEGEVEFTNLESMVYYIYAVRNEAEGFWITGGYTPVLALNEINSFLLPCEWYRFDEKKVSRHYFPTADFLRILD